MHRLEDALIVKRERGVAMLMVMGFLTLLGSVVADFQFTSHVDLQLAFNARDELQAEYNALSALRMRALILRQSRKLQTAITLLMSGMGAGGQAPPMGQILEQFPVECGLMSAITKPVGATLEGDAASEDFFPGDCLATSSSEHAKIAINLLRNTINNRAQQVGMLLLGVLSDVKMRRHFEEDDRNGQHAESPLRLVNAITDWIDTDHTETGTLGDEDRPYQFLKDPYRAKNAPFDSVAELQLVYGIDDELYSMLRDQVTIYNDDPAIELGTAPIERILYWGLPAAMVDGANPDQLVTALPALGQRLMMLRQIGGAGFGLLNLQTLQLMIQEAGLSNIVDSRKLPLVFSDKSSTTWYTIEAQGRVANASRRIRAVFQASEGQFYHVRVE